MTRSDQTPRAFIAVASAEHVRRGIAGGFMQVCHGKAAPLRRLRPGDRVAYYSPGETFGGASRLQSFTAIGTVADDAIVQVDMGGGFHPFRRAVAWLPAQPAPVRPLLETPGFALAGAGWGARLRYGLLEIDSASMDRIADAMGAVWPRSGETVSGVRAGLPEQPVPARASAPGHAEGRRAPAHR